MNILEAFQALKTLDEDVFSVSDDGIKKMSQFMSDDLEDEIEVADLDAETEDDIKDSYVGKVILDCCVCHSKLYKDKADVVIGEDDKANIDEECPFCFTTEGYDVVGEVAPFAPETEEVEEEEEEEKVTAVEEKYLRRKARVNEGINDLSITTDDTHMTMTSDDEGKVTVTTEPVGAEEAEGGEMIAPLSDETKGELGMSIDGEEDFVFDEEEVVEDETAEEPVEEEEVEEEEVVEEEEDDDYNESFNRNRKGKVVNEGIFGKKDNRLVLIADQAGDGEWGVMAVSADRNKLNQRIKEIDASADKRGFDKYKFKIVDKKTAEKMTGSRIDMDDNSIDEAMNEGIFDKFKKKNKEKLYAITVRFVGGKEKIVDAGLTREDAERKADGYDKKANANVIEVNDADWHRLVAGKQYVPTIKDTIDELHEFEGSFGKVEEGKDSEYCDIQMEDFDDKAFNELCESYLNKTYNNVKSFKTTNITEKGNSLVVEGVINFKSGKHGKTNFVFEAIDITKDGKARFAGRNSQINEGVKRAFTLGATIKEGVVTPTFLDYRYNQLQEGKKVRVAGRSTLRG